MAAIDFPSSPTVGQIVTANGRSWVWDGTTWAAKTLSTRAVSDTVPTSPVSGDEWFNSATGRLYTYFDSYWVEIGASVAGAAGNNGTSATLAQVVRDSATSTNLVASDKSNMVRFTGSSSQQLTVNNVLSTGESTSVLQDGTGQVTFSAGSGVTLFSNGAFSTRSQYSKVDVACVASGQYRLLGDVTPQFVLSGGQLSVDTGIYRAIGFTASGTLTVQSAGTVDYMIIGGGGGGGGRHGGGGGAGGYRTGTMNLTAGTYTVTIGAGGAEVVNTDNSGNDGTASSFSTVSSAGGGGGGSWDVNRAGRSGGSGGGASGNTGAAVGSGNTPSTSPSQGNNGGTAGSDGFGGGGGGSGSVGGNFTTGGPSGPGGAGTLNTILGPSYYWAGGGGGGGWYGVSGTAGSGGAGGGGAANTGTAGAINSALAINAGTAGTAGYTGRGGNAGANTGSGGGGGCQTPGGTAGYSTVSGAGGSGIIVFKYVR